MSRIRARAGFTLIELMVVVIIIAALAGMVLPRVLPAADEAKKKIAAGDIAGLSVALKMYRLQNDSYPSGGNDALKQLVPKYLEKAPRDPWKRDYNYRYPAQRSPAGFDIWSDGPDGVSGNDDDVTNWEE
jgi:general secretion pathway protein G